MKSNFRRTAILLSVAAAAAVGLGCGGAGTTNNDQGVAVTFLGYYSESATGCGALPRGLSGAVLPLGDAEPEPSGELTPGGAGLEPGSGYVGVVGVQNNLFGQYFRGDRLLLNYFIPGAQIQPPSTTIPVSLFAGPSPGAGGGQGGGGQGGGVAVVGRPIRDPINTSLPPSFTGTCNRTFSQTILIPAAVREWMNFNRDQLPEPPFQMTVTGRITGMTSAGDRFETQSEDLLVSVIPETLVIPTEGTDEGAGDTNTAGQTIDESFGDDIADPSDDPTLGDLGTGSEDSGSGTTESFL